MGLAAGLLYHKEGGSAFTLKGLPDKKGPYYWFSYNRNPKPAPNWEWFVHGAEFIRFHTIASSMNALVTFEDDDMDIALYRDNRLIVDCEVKERLSQIQKLIRGVQNYQSAVNLDAPDRGNDPLRKAKCIVRRKPQYFVGAAIGARFEYKVNYLGERSFHLIRDIVPFLL